MAIEILLKLDNIDGESEKPGAEGWIEIISFSNGASNPSNLAFGAGSDGGRVDVSSLSLQKQLDKATPMLFLNCASGKHSAKATMIVREATGESTTKPYYQYDMTEVSVDSISWGGAAGGGKPSESISLSAKSLKISYWYQKSDGTLGGPIVAGWDVSKNTKL